MNKGGESTGFSSFLVYASTLRVKDERTLGKGDIIDKVYLTSSMYAISVLWSGKDASSNDGNCLEIEMQG